MFSNSSEFLNYRVGLDFLNVLRMNGDLSVHFSDLLVCLNAREHLLGQLLHQRRVVILLRVVMKCDHSYRTNVILISKKNEQMI